MISTDNISKHLDVLDTILEWHRDEWGDDWAEQVRKSTNPDSIPTLYVALQNGKPVGTAMLLNVDMHTHPELRPWLGGVYVPQTHRGQGIASKLTRHAMQAAAKMGVKKLWLYTDSAPKLYENLGWQHVAHEDYLGKPAVIMSFDFESLPFPKTH